MTRQDRPADMPDPGDDLDAFMDRLDAMSREDLVALDAATDADADRRFYARLARRALGRSGEELDAPVDRLDSSGGGDRLAEEATVSPVLPRVDPDTSAPDGGLEAVLLSLVRGPGTFNDRGRTMTVAVDGPDIIMTVAGMNAAGTRVLLTPHGQPGRHWLAVIDDTGSTRFRGAAGVSTQGFSLRTGESARAAVRPWMVATDLALAADDATDDSVRRQATTHEVDYGDVLVRVDTDGTVSVSADPALVREGRVFLLAADRLLIPAWRQATLRGVSPVPTSLKVEGVDLASVDDSMLARSVAYAADELTRIAWEAVASRDNVPPAKAHVIRAALEVSRHGQN